MLKVLYLFNQPRKVDMEQIEKGERHDGHLYGLRIMSKFGIKAEYLEIEQYMPSRIAKFLRRHLLNIYTVHLPLFFKFRKYDIVFTPTSFGSQFMHALLGCKKPKWVMYDFSIMGLIGDGKTFKQKIFKWMTSKASGIVTIGKLEAELLKSKFPHLQRKIMFIPYSVDDDFFRLSSATEKDQIISVGFDIDRDFATFFKASADLNISVVVAGNPKKIAKAGIPDFVTVKWFNHHELTKEYESSKIVVIPLDISKGNNEAMGCSTLVEAFIMGRPVIATRTPTMESYIMHGVNGMLVNPKDPEDMRKAIKFLLENNKGRIEMGKRAREFALKYCTKEQGAKQLSDFFKSL